MTDIQQVTDTMTYEVKNFFISAKRWSGRTYHVMKIIKQTEKAVYCTIENENRFGFETWIPKSCLIQVEREAPKSCVREIGGAMCEWRIFGNRRMGYADWESAKKYIKKCASKYGMRNIQDINLNERFISLSESYIQYDTEYYDLKDLDCYESVDELINDEVRRLRHMRSPCSTMRAYSYFREETKHPVTDD